MSKTTGWALFLTILLWSSAFVGIRIALHGYSPGSLALFRYLIASGCMSIVYFCLPKRTLTNVRDRVLLIGTGAIGIGLYNLMLNSGEIAVASGMASFIISMAPIITTLLAVTFLGEKLNLNHVFGLLVSLAGLALIILGEGKQFSWEDGLIYILIATVAGSLFTVMQKPFVAKYNVIEVTAHVIWGGALSLILYLPELMHQVQVASSVATLTIIYLGVFPAAIGYLAWSYVLTEISASRAVAFLYFQPFIVTLLGWLLVKEVPALLALCGGIFTLLGVWLVNRPKKVLTDSPPLVAINA